MPRTIIVSNGSKWAGEPEDSPEVLLEVLQQVPLDRSFEDCGNFYSHPAHLCDNWGGHNHDSEYEGLDNFFGNFLGTSHVFNIYTDDPELITPLLAAIRANQQRPDYLSQAQPERGHPFNEDCSCIMCRYEANRKTCPVCQGREA